MDWNSKNDRREFQQVNCSIAQLGPIWQPVLIATLTLPVTPRNCSVYSLIPITHSAAHPTLGFSFTWLYNLTIFLKSPMLWKKSATQHKSHQISDYVPSDKPRPCDNKKSDNLLWIFSGLCSRVLFFLFHWDVNRKKGMHFLHCPNVRYKYLPKQKTSTIKPKKPHKSPRNLVTVGLGWSRSKGIKKASEKI